MLASWTWHRGEWDSWESHGLLICDKEGWQPATGRPSGPVDPGRGPRCIKCLAWPPAAGTWSPKPDARREHRRTATTRSSLFAAQSTPQPFDREPPVRRRPNVDGIVLALKDGADPGQQGEPADLVTGEDRPVAENTSAWTSPSSSLAQRLLTRRQASAAS
ncbi:hypothetical protein GCM10023334_012670 [Nonomuraea thailandensis]